MSKETIYKILGELKDAGCLTVTFSGGEIFLREDFFTLANYARKLNFALELFSNGTLISEATADRLRTLLPIIYISLYGFKNSHEKITRVAGSFERTIRAIRLLKQRKVKVYINTALMKDNVKEIWSLHKFIRNDLGVNLRGLGGGTLLYPCLDGDKGHLRHRLGRSELKRYLEELFREANPLKQKFMRLKLKENDFLCAAGLAICNITADGRLDPCLTIRLEKNNDLTANSFKHIWQENENFRKLRSLRVKDRKDCLGCKDISYCLFCPGMSRLEKGSWVAKTADTCLQARIKNRVFNLQGRYAHTR